MAKQYRALPPEVAKKRQGILSEAEGIKSRMAAAPAEEHHLHQSALQMLGQRHERLLAPYEIKGEPQRPQENGGQAKRVAPRPVKLDTAREDADAAEAARNSGSRGGIKKLDPAAYQEADAALDAGEKAVSAGKKAAKASGGSYTGPSVNDVYEQHATELPGRTRYTLDAPKPAPAPVASPKAPRKAPSSPAAPVTTTRKGPAKAPPRELSQEHAAGVAKQAGLQMFGSHLQSHLAQRTAAEARPAPSPAAPAPVVNAAPVAPTPQSAPAAPEAAAPKLTRVGGNFAPRSTPASMSVPANDAGTRFGTLQVGKPVPKSLGGTPAAKPAAPASKAPAAPAPVAPAPVATPAPKARPASPDMPRKRSMPTPPDASGVGDVHRVEDTTPDVNPPAISRREGPRPEGHAGKGGRGIWAAPGVERTTLNTAQSASAEPAPLAVGAVSGDSLAAAGPAPTATPRKSGRTGEGPRVETGGGRAAGPARSGVSVTGDNNSNIGNTNTTYNYTYHIGGDNNGTIGGGGAPRGPAAPRGRASGGGGRVPGGGSGGGGGKPPTRTPGGGASHGADIWVDMPATGHHSARAGYEHLTGQRDSGGRLTQRAHEARTSRTPAASGGASGSSAGGAAPSTPAQTSGTGTTFNWQGPAPTMGSTSSGGTQGTGFGGYTPSRTGNGTAGPKPTTP